MSALLRFTKMQGAGNDFVVVDATRTPFVLDAAQIRLLCDRRVPLWPKAVLVGTLVYVASPIDLLPDLLPLVGQLISRSKDNAPFPTR